MRVRRLSAPRAEAVARAPQGSPRIPEPAAGGGTATLTKPAPVVRSRIATFGVFWYDFIVGDDWQIAAGVGLAFVVTFVVSFSPFAWIVLPVFVLALIPYGVKRALR
jgi:hypothetical protein